jgi:hypothetical protein
MKIIPDPHDREAGSGYRSGPSNLAQSESAEKRYLLSHRLMMLKGQGASSKVLIEHGPQREGGQLAHLNYGTLRPTTSNQYR